MQSLPFIPSTAVIDLVDGSKLGLDFNRLLVKNAPATFIMRVGGESCGFIRKGDLLVVDRSLPVTDSALLVVNQAADLKLAYGKNILAGRERATSVWGVVIYVIHPCQ